MPQDYQINHRQPRSWTKITIQIPTPATDFTADFLAALTEGAVEHNSTYQPLQEHPGETSSLTAYLLDDANRNQKLERVHLFLQDLAEQYPNVNQPELLTDTIIEEDWNSNWKKQFKPLKLTKRLVIKPSWESYTPDNNTKVLELDPGMAFGTGMHPSTQLALQLIDDLYQPEETGPISVLDVGTGTGILGMSCALLGCPKVIGIDNDLDARVAAAANITHNHLEHIMTIPDKDLTEIDQTFELVIANIIHNTLVMLAAPLVARVKNNGFLIMAGILDGPQTDNIIEIFAELKMKLVKVQHLEEWCAVCLQKKLDGDNA